MSNLNLFDFSYNGFDGALPTSLGELIYMQYLYGSANNLTGIIPDVFDQSRLLRLVDLSHNNLNGHLPSSLGFITTLNFLNLFSNNLSGCIPLSYKNFCTTQTSGNYSYFNFNNNAGLPNNGDISSFCADETGVCTLEPQCGLIKFRLVTGTNPIDLYWSFAGFGEVTSHSGSYASFLPNQDTLDYLLDLNQVWYKFSIYNLEGGGLGTGYFEIRDYITDALLVANKPFDDYYSAQEFPVCEAPEYHNTFLVTNTNDSGPGSLRNAILKTREQFGHDTIEVLTAGVIELEQSVPSSFELLPSLGDVTLNGNGIIIDANQLGRHMQTFGNVRINNVTFKNGNSPSSAGAIWAGGQSDGDSLVLDCVLFENNRAQSYVGGGAFRTAKNTVVKAVNCTFSGNIADYNGGAIDLEPGSVFIAEYCTFSGNTAGGFGGAIHNNQGFLYLTSTILANSMPPGVDDLYNAQSATAARRSAAGTPINNNNLVQQCGGDCPGFTIQGLDPLLGPLMDNGGSTFPCPSSWFSRNQYRTRC